MRRDQDLEIAAGNCRTGPSCERVLVGIRSKCRRKRRQYTRLVAPSLQRAFMHESNAFDNAQPRAWLGYNDFADDSR